MRRHRVFYAGSRFKFNTFVLRRISMENSLSPVTIQQITVFIKTAQLGSFSKAAAQLHMTQPAVSKSIQKLEQYLDLPLFKRTTREMELTQPGRLLYNEWKKSLAAINASYNKALDIQRNERNVLSIGLLNTASPNLYFTEIERRFRKEHPDVMINLESGYLTDLTEKLSLNIYDAVMVADFLKYSLKERGLSWKWAAKKNACLLVNRSHPLAKRKEVNMRELKDCRFIALNHGKDSGYVQDIKERLKPYGAEPEIIYDFSSAYDLKYLFHPEEEVLLVDEFFDCPEDPDITAVRVSDEYSGIICAYSPDNRNPNLRLFLDTLPEI